MSTQYKSLRFSFGRSPPWPISGQGQGPIRLFLLEKTLDNEKTNGVMAHLKHRHKLEIKNSRRRLKRDFVRAFPQRNKGRQACRQTLKQPSCQGKGYQYARNIGTDPVSLNRRKHRRNLSRAGHGSDSFRTEHRDGLSSHRFHGGEQKIVGVEALSRGIDPSTGNIVSPAVLFETARRHGRALDLDRLCRKKSLSAFDKRFARTSRYMLWLNFDPGLLDITRTPTGAELIINSDETIRVV